MSEKRGGLLPCPFCNALGYWIGGLAGYKIKCTNTECGAQSDLTEVSHEAIKRWNHRAAPAAVEPAIAPDDLSLRAAIVWAEAMKMCSEMPVGHLNTLIAAARSQQRPATPPTAEKAERAIDSAIDRLVLSARIAGRTANSREEWHKDQDDAKAREQELRDLIERLAAAQQEQLTTCPNCGAAFASAVLSQRGAEK